MSAAMTLASCGGTKDAGQQQDAAALIQRSDIKIEGKRMTPEALWAMGRIGSVAVSPDEKQIAYTVSYYSVPQNKSNSEVFVMNADGSGNTQITHDAWQEGQPTWFKDGKKLAFLCNESGSSQVWEMNPDGSGRKQLTQYEGDIEGFSFSPDGKKLLFIAQVKTVKSTADKHPDLPKATGIIVTDTSNSQWYAVRLTNGSTGYIYAEYIRITGDVGTPSAPAEPTPAPSNPEAEQTAKTTEYVNFRTGPGTNYSSKGVISLGTTVTVTDTSNSQWYAVRLANGSTGYIFAQYIKITSTPSATATPAPTPTPAPSDPSKEQTAKTTEYVNFRTGPGTNYSSKGVIPSGTAITVTDTSNSQWYAVRLADGSTGYIYAQYIKITSATAMPAPTEAPADGTVRAKTTADVNLRKGAGTNYGVIRVVGNNTAVTVTEATNTWYKVKLSDGTEGYLYASTLPSPPATSTASRKRRPPIPPRSPKPNRKQSPSSIRSAGTCARPTTGPHTHFRITRSARRSPATAFIPNGTQTSALTITRVTATSWQPHSRKWQSCSAMMHTLLRVTSARITAAAATDGSRST